MTEDDPLTSPVKASPLQALDQQMAMTNAEERIKQRGAEVIASGKFLNNLTTSFQKIWCGDTHVMLWVVHAFAAGFVSNNDEGLHLAVLGASGLGKSEGVKAALSLLLKEYVISGGFSRKGLLYLAEKMHACSIVLMDDHTMDEDSAGIYRAILAGWKDPSEYHTVDRNSKTVKIPERITQIVTSADGLATVSSEGQNESRFCILEISRNRDDMERISDFILNPEKGTISPEEKECIMAGWQHIVNNPKPIDIPFSQDIGIEDSSLSKMRELKKFLCLIRASALLNGRPKATEEDFRNAQHLWSYLVLMLDNETAGLSKNESIVYEKIKDLAKGGKRVYGSALISELSKLKSPNIYRALRGNNGSFENVKGGILSKVRGLRIDFIIDKATGERDFIITMSGVNQFLGQSPYTLEIVK